MALFSMALGPWKQHLDNSWDTIVWKATCVPMVDVVLLIDPVVAPSNEGPVNLMLRLLRSAVVLVMLGSGVAYALRGRWQFLVYVGVASVLVHYSVVYMWPAGFSFDPR
jgi:hypothetical protein